jgi:hypothetical protein
MIAMQSVAARAARAMAVLCVLTMLSGCGGTFYVDTGLHDLSTDEMVKVADKHPVQLLFDFQTKGVHNAQVTEMAKLYAIDAANDSGLFSQVSTDPVQGGAVLNIVVNNVPLTDDAFAKGFVTGFTLGLVGSTVGDGYICTVDYLPPGNAPKITKSMRDAIYMSLGATASTPEHAAKVANMEVAFHTMMRQVVSNTLNEVAKDASFGGKPASTAAGQ